LPDVTMTSLAAEIDRPGPLLPCFSKRTAFAVAGALGCRQRLISPARLRAAMGAPVLA
jgi:hypothetical protein